MSALVFEAPKVNTIAIKGSAGLFPVHRIFCVGRNYAAHAAEMGVEADREAPFYFTKSPSAAIASGSVIAYPPGTENFHYEMELAVAIGKKGFRVPVADAASLVYGYCSSLDMTRRDLQLVSRAKQRPWDTGKDVEQSAVFAPITTAGETGELGPKRIWLAVNGEVKQDAHLSDLIHSVPEIIADLSKYYHLVPGDVILTGTPAGVGAVVAGDVITGGIDGLDGVELTIGDPE